MSNLGAGAVMRRQRPLNEVPASRFKPEKIVLWVRLVIFGVEDRCGTTEAREKDDATTGPRTNGEKGSQGLIPKRCLNRELRELRERV